MSNSKQPSHVGLAPKLEWDKKRKTLLLKTGKDIGPWQGKKK